MANLSTSWPKLGIISLNWGTFQKRFCSFYKYWRYKTRLICCNFFFLISSTMFNQCTMHSAVNWDTMTITKKNMPNIEPLSLCISLFMSIKSIDNYSKICSECWSFNYLFMLGSNHTCLEPECSISNTKFTTVLWRYAFSNCSISICK
jgi:hypothetical protein